MREAVEGIEASDPEDVLDLGEIPGEHVLQVVVVLGVLEGSESTIHLYLGFLSSLSVLYLFLWFPPFFSASSTFTTPKSFPSQASAISSSSPLSCPREVRP